MEGSKDQTSGTESTSTSTPQPVRGTAPPTTNLPPTLPLELLEQMFKALRPDVDVAQTLAYLTQTLNPKPYLTQTTPTSTSAAVPATIIRATRPMPSTKGGLTGDNGRVPEERATEVVEEVELPQSYNQIEVRFLEEGEDGATKDGISEDPEGEAAQAARGAWTAEGIGNPDHVNLEEVIPLQMDDFPGQPASALPALSPPVEMSPPAEEVPLLEEPSHPDEHQIIDPSCDSGAGKEEQRREKKRKEKLLDQPRVKKDKRQKKGGREEPVEEEQRKRKRGQETTGEDRPRYGRVR